MSMDDLRHPDCRYCAEYERIIKGKTVELSEYRKRLDGTQPMGAPVAAIRAEEPGSEDSQRKHLVDDLVVENVATFRAEMMSEDSLWMCCYLPGTNERFAFWVHAVKRGQLDFSITEWPEQWRDFDSELAPMVSGAMSHHKTNPGGAVGVAPNPTNPDPVPVCKEGNDE